MKAHNRQHTKYLPTNLRVLWWHSSWCGYPFALLFAAVAFSFPMAQKALGIQDFFIETPFVIATFLVGWFWGLGPGLLALLLELLAIDYWMEPPVGVFDFYRWPHIVSFASFVLLQLIILALVVMQKNYRQQLLLANRTASQRAEALAESNTRLQQADRVKDQFLSMASHELRTPVTAIYGSVQLLQRRLKRQSTEQVERLPVCEALDSVDGQLERLTDLINTLLDINTLRSGKIPVHLAPCDLRCLCQQVLEEQQSVAKRSIDLRQPVDPVIVPADQERLSQVVSNLVSNAFKYSPANTPICMEINQRPAEVNLAVSNQGPALSEEQQRTLFEPFYRSPEARSSGIPGWGLGLATCQAIVQQHHGRIWVESSEERGTTFFVALPLPTSPESI